MPMQRTSSHTRSERGHGVNTVVHDSTKAGQRARLVAAMLNVAAVDGYSAANVSEVIAAAGVSRPTFYEHFANKPDCFLAVHAEIATELAGHVHTTLQRDAPERALRCCTHALLDFAEQHPGKARFLINETMAAGRPALERCDRTVTQLAQLTDARIHQASPATPVPDISSEAVIGGLHWLLGPVLRRGDIDLPDLAGELDAWLALYEQPREQCRWLTLTAGPRLSPSPHASELATHPPAPLPPGRSKLTRAEVARNHRERLLYATALTCSQNGYGSVTINDIAKTARLDKRAFYKHFRDKQQAFLAVQELIFQQTIAVAASAYFSQQTWPERVWAAMKASAEFHDTHPLLAYASFVEAYALGGSAVQRIDDCRKAFHIFLQEGAQITGKAHTEIVQEAIGAVNFQIAYHEARKKPKRPHITRLTPHAAHIALTPYLGYDAANAFIAHAIAEEQTNEQPTSRPSSLHGA